MGYTTDSIKKVASCQIIGYNKPHMFTDMFITHGFGTISGWSWTSGLNLGVSDCYPSEQWMVGKSRSKLDDWLVGQGHPFEKYDFVNWDDEIPTINGKKDSWQPHHQPVKWMMTGYPYGNPPVLRFFLRPGLRGVTVHPPCCFSQKKTAALRRRWTKHVPKQSNTEADSNMIDWT